jgi:DNA-binding CsgD family transcriptional regulator
MIAIVWIDQSAGQSLASRVASFDLPGSCVTEAAREGAFHPGQWRPRLYGGFAVTSASSRTRVDDRLVMKLAQHLTDRDRQILRLLSSHRVLTTELICDVCFDNINTAQHRLTKLYGLRLVDRFQPLHAGYRAGPYHYVLDGAGALVLAVERGDDIENTRWRKGRALALAKSQHLAHLVGVNGFFTALIRESRSRPGCRLVEWRSEASWIAQFGDVTSVRPDGLGVWEENGVRAEFFLEYDRSTEPLDRIVAKTAGYEELDRALGRRRWVLFSFASPRRETGARAALVGTTALVATSSRAGGHAPHEAIWAPLEASGDRRMLIDLAKWPMPRTTQRARCAPRCWVT